MIRNNGTLIKYRPPTITAKTSEDNDVFEFAIKVGQKLNLNGFHQIECGKDNFGKVKLIEINPRLDATLPITKCYNHNFYELLLHNKSVGLMKPEKFFFHRYFISHAI